MNKLSVSLRGMRGFLTLWLTQAFSALGSSMTAFALVVWSYQAEGSALSTALLTVCSYAPYVVMSIFAGTLSDRWNKKKTLLICDALAINRAGEAGYGMVNTAVGIATLAGSLLVAALPQPKSRVKVICNTLLFAMSTENFLLAFGRIVPVWCLGAALGWIFIPMMSANLGALMRERVPVELQGRVYSVRNALQFFTIPVGYLAGGWLVDCVFEPLMAAQGAGSPLVSLFGAGKGAGAALTYCLLGVLGTLICLYFRRNRHIRALEG